MVDGVSRGMFHICELSLCQVTYIMKVGSDVNLTATMTCRDYSKGKFIFFKNAV